MVSSVVHWSVSISTNIMDQVLSCTEFICIPSMWIDYCSWVMWWWKKLYNRSGDHHQGMYCESPEEHQVLASVRRNQIPKFWSSHLSHGSWRGTQWAQEMSVPSACPCFAMFTFDSCFCVGFPVTAPTTPLWESALSVCFFRSHLLSFCHGLGWCISFSRSLVQDC